MQAPAYASTAVAVMICMLPAATSGAPSTCFCSCCGFCCVPACCCAAPHTPAGAHNPVSARTPCPFCCCHTPCACPCHHHGLACWQQRCGGKGRQNEGSAGQAWHTHAQRWWHDCMSLKPNQHRPGVLNNRWVSMPMHLPSLATILVSRQEAADIHMRCSSSSSKRENRYLQRCGHQNITTPWSETFYRSQLMPLLSSERTAHSVVLQMAVMARQAKAQTAVSALPASLYNTPHASCKHASLCTNQAPSCDW